MTTILDKVRALIARLSPEPICNICIAERLKLDAADQADQAVNELAGEDGFERLSAPCTICGEARPVIRRRGK